MAGSLSRSSSDPTKLLMTTPSTTATMMLKVNRASHLIKKSSPPAPATKPVTAPPPPAAPHHHRQPVIIYTHSPKVIHTKPQDFMALVQKLTGYNGGSHDNKTVNKTKLPPPPPHELHPPAVNVSPPPPPTPFLPLPNISPSPPPPPDKLYCDDFETNNNYVMAFTNGNSNYNNSGLVGLGLFNTDDSPLSICIMEDHHHQEYVNYNIKSCSNGGREGGSPPLINNKYNIIPPVYDQALMPNSIINSLSSCIAPGYGDFCCTNNNNNRLASAAMINNGNDNQTISAYYNNTEDGRREDIGTGYCFYKDGPLHVSSTSPPS